MINLITKYLSKYAQEVYRPKHEQQVFANVVQFLRENSLYRLVWTRFKRDILMCATLQTFLEKDTIPLNAKRILYVYLGTPNLGDSIMDLSPRALWPKDYAVDLYTNKAIASFYNGDKYFYRIITNPRELCNRYDFIILQSYSWRCLKFKWRFFLKANFACLYGHYYGCEFNRLICSDASWRRILGFPYVKSDEICEPIFNTAHKLDHAIDVGTSKNRIAIAVGGVVGWRTYKKWGEVIKRVHSVMPDVEWLLLGSENGKSDADEIISVLHSKIQIINEVGKLPLPGVIRKLSDVKLLLAADGGLLNIARTTKTPMVALFSGVIHPLMRFSVHDSVATIHTPNGVNDISPELISRRVIEFIRSAGCDGLEINFLGCEPECDGSTLR